MKIVQINAVNGILSTGRTTRELSKALRERGHDSYVIYGEGEVLEGEQTYKMGSWWGHKLHGLCSRITGLQGYFSRYSTVKMLHYLKKLQPEIVHLRNLHSNYIHVNLLLRYLAKEQIPTVITLHDCWFYTGRCSHYTKNKCYQWKTGCKRCPNNQNNMPSWFFDRSKKMWLDKKKYFQELDHLAVVGVSDWITSEAGKSFLTHGKLIKRIYNWIDLQTFLPRDTTQLRQELGLEHQFILLGVASKWERGKGLHHFLSLAERLAKDFTILLVGGMEEDITLPPNVINIPLCSDLDQLAMYYAMSDVLVSLSKEESFGKVMAEALACGTPLVVYNSTACPELVGEGCGYVAKHNRLKEIYDGILKIHENKKEYYSPHCRNYAIENFGLSQGVEAYIELYGTLIQGKTP